MDIIPILVILAIILIGIISLISYIGRSEIKDETLFVNNCMTQSMGLVVDVTHLISHDRYTSLEIKGQAIRAFPKWIETLCRKMHNIDKHKRTLLRQASKRKKSWEFEPKEFAQQKPQINGFCIIENCFTDIFSSAHDKDDWALKNKLTDIFILEGISKEESKQTVVYLKQHFVNHEKTSGIIWFDLYIPEQVRGVTSKTRV